MRSFKYSLPFLLAAGCGTRAVDDTTASESAIAPVTTDVGTTAPQLFPSTGSQTRPSLIRTSTGYVAVWREHLARGPARLVTARVGADGQPLDRPGVVISDEITDGSLISSAVAAGDRLVVAFERRARTLDEAPAVVLAMVDGSNVTTVELARYAAFPSVAVGGSQALVSWSSGLGVSGALVDLSTLAVSRRLTLGAGVYAEVAYDGQRFVAGWSGSYGEDVTLAEVRADGSLRTNTLPLAAGRVAIAASPAGTYLAWSGTGGLRGSRVAPELDLVTAGGDLLVPNVQSVDRGERTFAVAGHPDGSFTLAAGGLGTPSGLGSLHIESGGATGALHALPALKRSSGPSTVALVANGDRAMVLFNAPPRTADSSDIFGLPLDANAAPLPPAPSAVAQAAPDQSGAFTAVSGDVTFVGWTERRNIDRGTEYSYPQNAIGMRVDAHGRVLDPTGIELALAGSDSASVSGVASAAGTFLVGIQRAYGADVVRIDAATGARAIHPFRPAGDGQVTQLRLAGRASDEFLAVWRGRTTNGRLAAVIDANGNARSPVTTLPDAFDGGFTAHVIVSNGSGYFLARKRGASLVTLALGADGAPIGAPLVATTGAIVEETTPAVATDGRGYFVASQSIEPNGCRVHAAYFDRTGARQWTRALERPIECANDGLAASFDGLDFIVAGNIRYAEGRTRMTQARVTAHGEVLAVGGGIDEGLGRLSAPLLSALPGGRALLIYERLVDDPGFGNLRVRAKVLPALE